MWPGPGAGLSHAPQPHLASPSFRRSSVSGAGLLATPTLVTRLPSPRVESSLGLVELLLVGRLGHCSLLSAVSPRIRLDFK